MYVGPGINGVPWISCLGNHDYGGRHFHAAWDQQIAYTWGPSGRWVLPALYYHQYVSYPTKGFSVDYYILDTNVADTADPTGPTKDERHNICNEYHNIGATAGGDPQYPKSDCHPFGPASPAECMIWFRDLWEEQVPWLRKHLNQSKATWQIIVTHFPPETCVHQPKFVMDLKSLGEEYGIDLVITGHRHLQALYATGFNDFSPTAGIPYVVSGGGGGVTAEGVPGSAHDGRTNSPVPPIDQYGFMDMILSKTVLKILSFNHAGTLIDTMIANPRARKTPLSGPVGR
jgi:tartrate-resistant acid phosphatase type 5